MGDWEKATRWAAYRRARCKPGRKAHNLPDPLMGELVASLRKKFRGVWNADALAEQSEHTGKRS
eukprot:1140453-Pelagomonas_calceolata.AAC.1